jgi:predicted outer membrane protein
MKQSVRHGYGHWLAMVLMAVGPLFACDDDDDDRVRDAAVDVPMDVARDAIIPDAPHDAVADAVVDRTDGEIAAVMATINITKIQHGAIALGRSQLSVIRNLAGQMITEHTDAQQRLVRLLAQSDIAPRESALNDELESDWKEITETLQSLSVGQFDRTFLQHQEVIHVRALTLLDHNFLVRVRNADLRDELEDVRAVIASQLNAVRQLRVQLDPDAGVPDAAADANHN